MTFIDLETVMRIGLGAGADAVEEGAQDQAGHLRPVPLRRANQIQAGGGQLTASLFKSTF